MKELRVWLIDGGYLSVTGEGAENAAIELFQYSRNGQPRFIEIKGDTFIAVHQISSYKVIKEDTK